MHLPATVKHFIVINSIPFLPFDFSILSVIESGTMI